MGMFDLILLKIVAGAGASFVSLIAFAVSAYRKSSTTINVMVFIFFQVLVISLTEIGTSRIKRGTIENMVLFSIIFLVLYGVAAYFFRLSKKKKGLSSASPSENNIEGEFCQNKDGSFIDAERMKLQESKNIVNELPEKADFEKASHFFPDLQAKLNELVPFGAEIQYRFIKEILETKNFSNPESVVDRIINEYAASRFGSDKSLQKFGSSLVYKRSYEAANELESYIRVVGDAVPSEEIVRQIENKFRYSSFTKRILRLYSVEKRGKTYFVAILKDRSCIGEIEGIYRKAPDLTRFRQAADDADAIYSLVHSHEAVLDFVGKVPFDLWN